MRPKLTHGIILTLAALGGLFYLKYTVEEKEQQLAGMKTQYLEDQKALRVLKAEWAYLNSPDYLQELSQKYLMLRPVASKQVASWFEDIPGRYQPGGPVSVALQEGGADREGLILTSAPPGGGDEP